MHRHQQQHDDEAQRSVQDRRKHQQRADHFEEEDEVGQCVGQRPESAQPLADGRGVAIDLQGVVDGGAVRPPICAGLQDCAEEVDRHRLQQHAGRCPGDMPVIARRRRVRQCSVDTGTRRHRQEHGPEQQAGHENVAAEQHQRIAVQEAGVEHDGDDQRRPRAPAEHDHECRDHLDRKQRADEKTLTVGAVQRDAPEPVDADQPVARHHAEVGVEHRQIDRAHRQISEQHGAQCDAEQRQRAQVDAENDFEPALEPVR